jgi:hypothetical protein
MAMSESEPRKRSLLLREIAAMRRRLDSAGFRGFTMGELEEFVRRNSRRRPPGMAPALVEPPRGPKPLTGGAVAPLEFRED